MSQVSTLAELPEAILKAENLPSPPSVAMEVLRLTGDDGVGIDDLAAVISRDPALSAKLLKLSNSSLFRRGAEVLTLDRATMVLGLKTVKLMALSFSLAGTLPRDATNGNCFNYQAYWMQSLTMAVAGRSLAQLVRSRNYDEAFMCGLLARIGQLTMAECTPDSYGEVVEFCAGSQPTADIERRFLGYDHVTVGAALLERWEMPAQIWRSILHAADPAQLPADADPTVEDLAWVLHLAAYATTVICDSRKGPALHALHELAAARYQISDAEIDSFLIGLQNGISETAQLLNVDLGEKESHERIIELARMQMVNISLGTAADLQQTAHRAAELEREKQELTLRASTDKLTGIRNRAHFDDLLKQTVRQRMAGERSDALGLLVLDVDHFKRFNDTHGHLAGDTVLKAVAAALESSVRQVDCAARYGGEEFVVILHETDDRRLADTAERIRTAVESMVVNYEGQELRVTASIGGASVINVDHADEGPALLKLADECLYQAKKTGRNRVVVRGARESLTR
ncbi:MAG: GGDEF domain-containing protein [Planctomycetes bacterium]|nr:GGDEF domain-containing protein [Planctomycetota bacterium]